MHWASLWGRPQHWRMKGTCVTADSKQWTYGTVAWFWDVRHTPVTRGGAQTVPKFWDLLHARTRYQKQQHHHQQHLYSLRISICTSFGKLYSYRNLSRTARWRNTLTAALKITVDYFSTWTHIKHTKHKIQSIWHILTKHTQGSLWSRPVL